jgi:AcrR family transcriptional regulator
VATEQAAAGKRSAGQGRGKAVPTPPAASTRAKATRRRRGEPRRLLLEAARDLFSRQGYIGTTTREIADRANVSETLMFRYFDSKAGLFREALVVPFVDYIEDFHARWMSGAMDDLSDEEFALQLNGDLFDLFRTHRGLVLLMWAGDSLNARELAESGVHEIDDALKTLVKLGSTETIRRQGSDVAHHDLSTRVLLATIAGMAVFGEPFYGKRPPSRKAIVEEITNTILHGRLHRTS